MTDYRTLQDALLAGTLGIAQHGEAVAQEPSGDLGYIDDDGAWCPRRLRWFPPAPPSDLREMVGTPLTYRVVSEGVVALGRMALEDPAGFVFDFGPGVEAIAERMEGSFQRGLGETDSEFRARLLRHGPSIAGDASWVPALDRLLDAWGRSASPEQDDRHPMEDVAGGD